MEDARWLARISTPGPGGLTGAGLLISPTGVLTCAHVVRGAEQVTVRLVNRPGHPELAAEVELCGPWPDRPGGAGDVALLRLARPVPPQVATPAPFAPLHRWAGPPAPALAAYGFPAGHDNGLSSEVRVTRGGFRIGGELVQLEHEGTGMPLSPGFSGGPVLLAATGRVVGIVTAALDTIGICRGPDDSAPAVRLGQMLPAEALARYVPELADRLPGAALPPGAVRELRLLLAEIPPPADPLELYRAAVGPLGCPDPPYRPENLWEACWYLLAEVPRPPGRPHPVLRFAEQIAALAGPEAIGLRRWLVGQGGGGRADPVPVRRPRWRPILVDLAPSGAGPGMFHVAISTIRDGALGTPHARTVPRPLLKSYVRARIDQELGQLEPDGAELIVFSLPRRWLTEPVHSWARRKADYGPLGADHAVVVVDQQRRSDPADRRQLELKWEPLRQQPGTLLHPVGCDGLTDDRLLYHRLRPPERVELPALAGPPRAAPYDSLLAAALKAGVPAVLWPQQPCPDGHPPPETCRAGRLLARLAEELADVPPADLPRRIKDLRHQAAESEDPAAHWADGLVLLWEDPEVLPSPHRPYRVVPTARPNS